MMGLCSRSRMLAAILFFLFSDLCPGQTGTGEDLQLIELVSPQSTDAGFDVSRDQKTGLPLVEVRATQGTDYIEYEICPASENHESTSEPCLRDSTIIPGFYLPPDKESVFRLRPCVSFWLSDDSEGSCAGWSVPFHYKPAEEYAQETLADKYQSVIKRRKLAHQAVLSLYEFLEDSTCQLPANTWGLSDLKNDLLRLGHVTLRDSFFYLGSRAPVDEKTSLLLTGDEDSYWTLLKRIGINAVKIPVNGAKLSYKVPVAVWQAYSTYSQATRQPDIAPKESYFSKVKNFFGGISLKGALQVVDNYTAKINAIEEKLISSVDGARGFLTTHKARIQEFIVTMEKVSKNATDTEITGKLKEFIDNSYAHFEEFKKTVPLSDDSLMLLEDIFRPFTYRIPDNWPELALDAKFSTLAESRLFDVQITEEAESLVRIKNYSDLTGMKEAGIRDLWFDMEEGEFRMTEMVKDFKSRGISTDYLEEALKLHQEYKFNMSKTQVKNISSKDFARYEGQAVEAMMAMKFNQPPGLGELFAKEVISGGKTLVQQEKMFLSRNLDQMMNLLDAGQKKIYLETLLSHRDALTKAGFINPDLLDKATKFADNFASKEDLLKKIDSVDQTGKRIFENLSAMSTDLQQRILGFMEVRFPPDARAPLLDLINSNASGAKKLFHPGVYPPKAENAEAWAREFIDEFFPYSKTKPFLDVHGDKLVGSLIGTREMTHTVLVKNVLYNQIVYQIEMRDFKKYHGGLEYDEFLEMYPKYRPPETDKRSVRYLAELSQSLGSKISSRLTFNLDQEYLQKIDTEFRTKFRTKINEFLDPRLRNAMKNTVIRRLGLTDAEQNPEENQEYEFVKILNREKAEQIFDSVDKLSESGKGEAGLIRLSNFIFELARSSLPHKGTCESVEKLTDSLSAIKADMAVEGGFHEGI